MKKILIVSTVSRQFYLFEQGNIEVLNSLGYEVHTAANFSDSNERLDELNIIRHHFDIERSPYSLKNLKAYKQLKRLMKTENFDVVHCHSPMGGVLARLASKAVGITSVLYTAHGFHFYNGAPVANWLFYYPIEKYLSKYTDVLITINNEDFKRAQKFNANKVKYVPGIGIDIKKFSNSTVRAKKLKELEISNEKVVLLSVGEMIKRKNHETALKSLAKIKDQNFVYLICGKGELENYLQDLVKKLNLEDKVRFLGFRNDIHELCAASDVFIFPSYQEGLPVSVMEAMSAGMTIICSSIRGNKDLIENDIGGYLLAPEDIDGFAQSISKVIDNAGLRREMGMNNIKKVSQFDHNKVKDIMKEVYVEVEV